MQATLLVFLLPSVPSLFPFISIVTHWATETGGPCMSVIKCVCCLCGMVGGELLGEAQIEKSLSHLGAGEVVLVRLF